jgi:hypothetical protein
LIERGMQARFISLDAVVAALYSIIQCKGEDRQIWGMAQDVVIEALQCGSECIPRNASVDTLKCAWRIPIRQFREQARWECAAMAIRIDGHSAGIAVAKEAECYCALGTVTLATRNTSVDIRQSHGRLNHPTRSLSVRAAITVDRLPRPRRPH